MSLGRCRLPECTFNVTQVCVLGNPPDQCPNRDSLTQTEEADEVEDDEDVFEIREDDESHNKTPPPGIGDAVLEAPAEAPRLPPSLTMGLEEARQLMSQRYTTVVGVLGLPDSGKTACLVSAYLLLSRGQLEGYAYADSLTLMAFEQIARGSREWNDGEQPEELTVHTEYADDRQAGFMHLRLRRESDNELFDILVPDVPGEWTRALIDKHEGDRFDFLKSATVVWIMVDGRAFTNSSTRGYATYRTETLIERLSEILPTPRPRIVLVPSWRDLGDFPETSVRAIQTEGLKWGMEIELAPIASFSQNDNIAPGSGIADLVHRTLVHRRSCPAFWPRDVDMKSRAICSFGRSRD